VLTTFVSTSLPHTVKSITLGKVLEIGVADLPVIEIYPRNGVLRSTFTSAVEAEASLTIVIWLLVEVLENDPRGQGSLSDENQSRK
jgi:hypothetical protein